MLNRVVSLMLGTTQRKEEQWLAALLETWKVDEWMMSLFFFSSRRRHTRFDCDWSSDVCSSDLRARGEARDAVHARARGRASSPGGGDGGLLRVRCRDARRYRLPLVRDGQLLPCRGGGRGRPRFALAPQPRVLAWARLPRPRDRRGLDRSRPALAHDAAARGLPRGAPRRSEAPARARASRGLRAARGTRHARPAAGRAAAGRGCRRLPRRGGDRTAGTARSRAARTPRRAACRERGGPD